MIICSHPHFYTVADQFLREWKSPDITVSVKKIYKVTTPRDVQAKYDAYRYVFRFNIKTCLTGMILQQKTRSDRTWSSRIENFP
jgi:hypothetical protein